MNFPIRSLPRRAAALIAFVVATVIPIRAQTPAPDRAGPADTTAHYDLAYVTDAHAAQHLDLFLPAPGTGPFPLVIWIHGGAWLAGDKKECPPLRSGFVARGYAVASLNYRLSQDAPFPAQIEDCKAAIRWLRAHAAEYHLDPAHIGVAGSSAGGHLVALLGTAGDVAAFDVGENLEFSSRVQAVADYYGPTDFVQMDAHAVPKPRFHHDEPDSPEARLIGGPIQDPANYAKVQAANPITYVTSDDAPFVIVHGDVDPIVPHHQSELLHAQLVATGVPSHFITVIGGGHGQGFPGQELDAIISPFFDRLLRGDLTAADWPAVKTSTVNAVATPPRPAPATPAASATPAAQANANPGANRNGPPAWADIRDRSDRDHDGNISRDEFQGPPPLFARLDADGDGFLTEAEHNAFVQRTPRRN